MKDHLPDYFADITTGQIKKWVDSYDYKSYNDYLTRKLDELGINVPFRKRKLDHYIWYNNRKRRSIKEGRIKQMWMTFHLLNRGTKNKEGYEVVSNVVFLETLRKNQRHESVAFFVDIQALRDFNTLLKLLPIKKHVLLDNRVLKTISNNYINKKHYSLLSIIC